MLIITRSLQADVAKSIYKKRHNAMQKPGFQQPSNLSQNNVLDFRNICNNPRSVIIEVLFVPTQNIGFNSSKQKYTRYLSKARLYFHVSYTLAKLSIKRSKCTKVIEDKLKIVLKASDLDLAPRYKSSSPYVKTEFYF